MKTRHNAKNHFAFKPSRAAKGKSIGGASKFIRNEIARGVEPQAVKSAVIARWPKFATKAEKPFLAKRIQIAVKLAKAQAAN